MKRGLGEQRAWKSATNGRGPWWNSGAPRLHEALSKRFFDGMGFVLRLDYLRLTQGASGTAVYGTVGPVV